MTNTCEHELRTGPCKLDAGHKGRHSTVVFGCDLCDRTYRGSPYKVWNEGVDDTFQCCFPCAHYSQPERHPASYR